MPKALLKIAPELIVEILKGLKASKYPHFFRVVRNGLPQDVQLEQVLIDKSTNNATTLAMELTSVVFTEGQLLETVWFETVEQRPPLRQVEALRHWQEGTLAKVSFYQTFGDGGTKWAWCIEIQGGSHLWATANQSLNTFEEAVADFQANGASKLTGYYREISKASSD